MVRNKKGQRNKRGSSDGAPLGLRYRIILCNPLNTPLILINKSAKLKIQLHGMRPDESRNVKKHLEANDDNNQSFRDF